MNNFLARIPQRYWAYLLLITWGVLSYQLLSKDSYGINESAARILLLVWSVADHVVSPAVTWGFPDFRAIFLAPVGFLWTGSLIATKVFTLLLMAGAVWSIHAWRRQGGATESALLASALLLLTPLLIHQINSLSVFPFLLLTFALGAWADQKYRDRPLAFGGKYFAQLFLCLASVTFHPAGLAYPAALAWSWYRSPTDAKQQKYVLSGIAVTVFLGVALPFGWNNIAWFGNPLLQLSELVSGTTGALDSGVLAWIIGTVILITLLAIIWQQIQGLWADLLGRTLLISFVIGIFNGDNTWSLLALSIGVYWGFPLLLQTDAPKSAAAAFKRNAALLIFFILASVFMLFNKASYQSMHIDNISPSDNLIRAVTEVSTEFEKKVAKSADKTTFRVASQWPGRTMLACRCDTLPLPPAAKDEQELLAMLRGVNYLMFDPRNPANLSLARNLSMLDGGSAEVIAMQSGGVIIAIKHVGDIPGK
jgi:hypothetical protein